MFIFDTWKILIFAETRALYAQSDEDEWKTKVTEDIQKLTVNEFLDKGKTLKCYHDEESGLDFLRGAVGSLHLHTMMPEPCRTFIFPFSILLR